MTQPSSTNPRKRRSLSWPRLSRPQLTFRPWMRQAALCLALMVLTACYAGPLHQEATAVLAVKRVLPVYSVEREDPVISISFDASWGGDKTMGILDLLDQYNAKATFYLVGIWVDKFPELVRDEGYEVVQWSVDSLDWKNRGVNDLIKRATSNVNKGDIILFHNDSQYILDALPTILKSYTDKGFTMIPCGEILLTGDTTIDVQGKQHPVATKAPAQ